MPKKLTIDELNRIYEDAEHADKEIFAEQRSNVLLVAGDHYNRKGIQRTHNRIRTNAELTENQKLRLTKNHMHKVARHYAGNILSYAPGVAILPQKENELQDTAAAEINQSVWVDAKSRYRLNEKKRSWCRSFVQLGEVCLKLFWDPNAGDLLGYEQAFDEKTQQLAVDPGTEQMAPHPMSGEMIPVPGTGQPTPDMERPRFTGAFVWEEVYGFNLLRHIGAREMRDSECWIVRKMVDTKKLQDRYKDDPVKVKMITESSKTDFIVFDNDKANYQKSKNQTLLREYYWPVSIDYPEGYFALATESGVLEEGPLPYGIFPLVWKPFDEYATTPRGRSILKIARPYQAEINRASSAMAMHQITIGDDKVLYQAGTKLQPGALLPGVRGISFAGATPTILPGRDGGQYLPYIESQIAEMYDVLMLQEENQEKEMGQMDPDSLLFRSMKQQRKFAEYGEKFEEFQIEVCELFLKLARKYYDDTMFVVSAGSKERVNIDEFRTTDPLSYKIKLEARDETLDTQFGKTLMFKHVLQYASGSLGKEDVGKIMRAMPFANSEEAFGDLTLDYDAVKNDMLQMERGKAPPLGKYDDPKYALKRLTNRTRESDFQFLPPQVQQLYDERIQQYEKIQADQAQKLIDAKNEFIPTGGAMITCDMYVQDTKDPAKSNRVRIPYQALNWLIEKTEKQGQSLQTLEQQNKGNISEMANMLLQKNAGAPVPSPSNGSPQMSPGRGMGVPQ